MSIAAIIFMLVSWGIVFLLIVVSFSKVLK